MKINCSVAYRKLFLRKVSGSLRILSQLSSRNFQMGKVEAIWEVITKSLGSNQMASV